MRSQIFTKQFSLACVAIFLFIGSFLVLISTLPLYILEIGGRVSQVGIVMGAFSVTALLLRPAAGKWVDHSGKRAPIILGSCIFCVASLLFILAESVFMLVMIRVLQGVGMATFTTGIFTLVVDSLPEDRRGEGIGIFWLFSSLAMAVGPAIGLFVAEAFGFTVLFCVSFSSSLLSLLLVLQIEEPPAQTQMVEDELDLLHIILLPAIIIPLITALLVGAVQGTLMSFLPLFAQTKGFAGTGFFYPLLGVGIVSSRLITGRLADHMDRRRLLVPFLGLIGLGMLGLSLASSPGAMLVTALIYGLGFGCVSPLLNSLMVDNIEQYARGRALGLYQSAFDLGIASGAILLGRVADTYGLMVIYQIAAGLGFTALIFFALTNKHLEGLPPSLSANRVRST